MTSKVHTYEKNEDDAKKDDAPATCGSLCVADIANLLEEHRAAISAEFKIAFTSLEERMVQIEASRDQS